MPARAPRPPAGSGSALIDLGRGHPSSDLLPFDAMLEAGTLRLARRDPASLQYGDELGAAELREEVGAYVERVTGAAPGFERLAVTGGVSQALDLLCTLLTRPGDVVLVEEPTYHLAKLVFRDHGLRQVAVAGDEHGVLPEALEEALRLHPGALVYLVPSFGNPTGATVGPERAERIVSLTERSGSWVLADEVYRFLSFGEPPPSLAADGRERVVSLNSFSKILAPGLRLGWLDAAPELVQRFAASGLLLSGGGQNPFVGSLVAQALRAGGADAHLAMLRRAFERRAAVLGAALRHALPAAEFATPEGGYFVWLRVPGAAPTGGALLANARANGVSFTPGAAFSTAGLQADRLRLSFAYHAAPELELGAARLAAAVRSAHEAG